MMTGTNGHANGTAATQAPAAPPKTLREEIAPEWMYPEMCEESQAIEYFLKSIRKDKSGRHGNLRLIVNHAKSLARIAEQMLERMETQ